MVCLTAVLTCSRLQMSRGLVRSVLCCTTTCITCATCSNTGQHAYGWCPHGMLEVVLIEECLSTPLHRTCRQRVKRVPPDNYRCRDHSAYQRAVDLIDCEYAEVHIHGAAAQLGGNCAIRCFASVRSLKCGFGPPLSKPNSQLSHNKTALLSTRSIHKARHPTNLSVMHWGPAAATKVSLGSSINSSLTILCCYWP
jgi:hypothetical protein